MIANKSISKYFENTESGRGPPKPKKETFFNRQLSLLSERMKMNHPAKNQKQNFKKPPQSFEATRGPPKFRKRHLFPPYSKLQTIPIFSYFLYLRNR